MQIYTKVNDTLDRMLDKLPFHLQNGEHIKAYYKVFSCLYDELINVFSDILDFLDIEQAYGFSLDLLGDTMNCPRPIGFNDENYRRILKIQIMRNNSNGTIEDINNLAKSLVGNKFMGVKQGYQSDVFNREPAAIEIEISGDELESSTIEINKMELKTGTINSGTHKLGTGIEGTPNKVIKKEFKGIEIPDMKHAIAAGVRLEYDIKSKPEIIEIYPKNKIELKSKTHKVEINKIDSISNFTVNQNIYIKPSHTIYDIISLQCGTTTSCSKMGVLL